MPVPDRESFAARCGTSYGHIRNVAYGKPCAEKLAINIDRESGGVVTCESLCPDVDFGYLRGRPAQIDEDHRHPRSKLRPLAMSGQGAMPGCQTNDQESTAAQAAIAAQVPGGAARTVGSEGGVPCG